MANPDFDDILTSTLEHRARSLCDNIFDATFLLNKLERTKRDITGGHSIVEEILYAKNPHGTWYHGYDTLPCKPTKSLTAIQNPWAQHAIPISICGYEEKVNRGTSEIIDLLTTRIRTAEQSVRDDWNYQLIHGDGSNPKAVHGLELLISEQPYGGIDPAECDWWLPYIVDPRQEWIDNGGDPADFKEPPLTWKMLSEAIHCMAGGRSRPDCIIMSKDLYLGLVAAAEGQQLVTSTESVRLGFTSINYLGVDISFDFDIPEGTVYLLNTDKLTLWCQSGCFLTPTPFKMGTDQDSRCAHLLSMLQLTTCERRAHGIIRCVKPTC